MDDFLSKIVKFVSEHYKGRVRTVELRDNVFTESWGGLMERKKRTEK